MRRSRRQQLWDSPAAGDQGQTLGEPGEQDRPRPHVQRKAGHLPQRGRGQQKPDEDEQAIVDPVDHSGDEKHRQHRAEPARRHHPAGVEHRVAHQHLHHRRHQRQDAAQDHAASESSPRCASVCSWRFGSFETVTAAVRRIIDIYAVPCGY
jgi:hypothetical protein